MFNKLRAKLKVKAEQKAVAIIVKHVQKQLDMKTTNNSWKSTLTGAIGAVFVACLPLIQTGTFDIKKDWPYLVGAAGTAFFGYITKDADKTGLPKE